MQKRRHSTDARSPVGKRRRTSKIERSETESLCPRCRNIETKVADRNIRTNPPTRIANVEDDHEELLKSACPFCRLLGSIKDPSLNGSAKILYVFSGNAIYAHIRPVTRSNGRQARDFIGVVDPEDERQRPAIGPRRILRDSIDYSMIQDWISFCQIKHKRRCDTSTSDIVKNMQCIDQDDYTNKHEQIRAMHLIYGNAVLTLIAAAGENSEYGLPGVGSREREEQNSLSIGNKLYIRTFPHASRTLEASKWATRGWTFQEGLLSKRRLIFTDHQVSFQCNGMHCSEAIHWPYELMHARTSDRFSENVPNAPFGGMTLDEKYHDEGRAYMKFMRSLADYTGRSLSFPSDILNAFLGILSNFMSRKNPIYHVWGVPVLLTHNEWSFKLNWKHSRPCKRRPGFPKKDSRGDQAETVDLQDFAKKHDIFSAYATSSPFLQVTISAFDLEFTHVTWSGCESAIQAYYRNKNAVRNSFVDPFKEGLYAKLPRRGYTELSYFWIDDIDFDTSSLGGNSLTGMLYDDNPRTTNITFIVLVHREENRYERLGSVRFSPTEVLPIPDVAFRLNHGELSKIRPDMPGSADEPELLVSEDRRKTLTIRLG
ncbi:hypothetical protein LA080_012375 [Diaporthe eres]|nr:hypothetical protein LA080_012375 [Diaporthe eres]